MRTPPSDPADAAELDRLEAAIKQARARRAQFIRDMSGRSRKREMQRLCTLGRAVENLTIENNNFAGQFQSYLRRYVTRDTDRMALAGSRFDVSTVHDDAPVSHVVED